MPLMIEADGPKGMGYSNTYVGGYAEQMLLSAPLMLEVPNGLPTEHAALTEPLAVGVHAVEKGALTGDEAPLVVGCGPVGLAVIAALRLKGVRRSPSASACRASCSRCSRRRRAMPASSWLASAWSRTRSNRCSPFSRN